MAQKGRTMTRLSTNIKEALWKKLAERAYLKQCDEVIKEQADFAARIYDECFSEKDRKRMYDLPQGWLPTDGDIKVKLAGSVTQFYFWGTGDIYNLPEAMRYAGAKVLDVPQKRFPSNKKDGVCGVIDGGTPLSEDWLKLQAKKGDLCRTIDDARRAAMVVMHSATTVKRLIDIWPEAEEFAKKYLDNGERKALLPAVSVERLNALLGLPPEKTQ